MVVVLIIFSLLIMQAMKISKKGKERARLLKSGILEADKMDGVQFEKFLQTHFENMGYKVEMTSTSHDYGADLILRKDGKIILVQAKRYSKPVSLSAVQEIVGAIAYYKGNKGIVVTNNYFTKNAIELVKSNNIELIDRDKLIDIITKNGSGTVKQPRAI